MITRYDLAMNLIQKCDKTAAHSERAGKQLAAITCGNNGSWLFVQVHTEVHQTTNTLRRLYVSMVVPIY
jgi:hypothetical protein